jgi:hypothetical protein
VKNLEAPQGTTLRASMLSSNGTAVFSKNYLSRISVSHDLVESELYKRCTSLLGELGIANGGPQGIKNGLIQVLGGYNLFYPFPLIWFSFSLMMIIAFLTECWKCWKDN